MEFKGFAVVTAVPFEGLLVPLSLCQELGTRMTRVEAGIPFLPGSWDISCPVGWEPRLVFQGSFTPSS